MKALIEKEKFSNIILGRNWSSANFKSMAIIAINFVLFISIANAQKPMWDTAWDKY